MDDDPGVEIVLVLLSSSSPFWLAAVVFFFIKAAIVSGISHLYLPFDGLSLNGSSVFRPVLLPTIAAVI